MLWDSILGPNGDSTNAPFPFFPQLLPSPCTTEFAWWGAQPYCLITFLNLHHTKLALKFEYSPNHPIWQVSNVISYSFELSIKRTCCIIDYSVSILLIENSIRVPPIMPHEHFGTIINFIMQKLSWGILMPCNSL